MHIPGADAQLPVFHQSQDHLGSVAVGNGVHGHIPLVGHAGNVLGAHAGAGNHVGGRYIEAQVVHLDPAVVVLQLAPDVDAVCRLVILLNGHGSILNQGIYNGAVQAGIAVHIQGSGAYSAGQSGQLDLVGRIGRYGLPCRSSRALDPAGNGADGGLIPDHFIDNGPVGNHKGVALNQNQQLLVLVLDGVFIHAGAFGRNGLTQGLYIGVGLNGAVGGFVLLAGILGRIQDGLLRAGIQTDVLHVNPAAAVHKAPAVFQLGHGHTGVYGNGAQELAAGILGVTDIDAHGAVGNGTVELCLGVARADGSGVAGGDLHIGHADPAVLAIVLDSAPGIAIPEFIELQLGAGGQRTDLVEDADLRILPDVQRNCAGHAAGGNHAAGCGRSGLGGRRGIGGGLQLDLCQVDIAGGAQLLQGDVSAVSGFNVAPGGVALYLKGADLLAVHDAVVELDHIVLIHGAHIGRVGARAVVNRQGLGGNRTGIQLGAQLDVFQSGCGFAKAERIQLVQIFVVIAAQLNPLVLGPADTAPCKLIAGICCSHIHPIDIDRAAASQCLDGSAGGILSSVNIHLDIRFDLNILLNVGISGLIGIGNILTEHVYIPGVDIEVTGLGVCFTIHKGVKRGGVVAPLGDLICHEEGNALCQIENLVSAIGSVIGEDAVGLDPAFLCLNGQSIGLGLFHGSAMGALPVSNTIGVFGRLILPLPVSIGMGIGGEEILILDIGAASSGAGNLGIAIDLSVAAGGRDAVHQSQVRYRIAHLMLMNILTVIGSHQVLGGTAAVAAGQVVIVAALAACHIGFPFAVVMTQHRGIGFDGVATLIIVVALILLVARFGAGRVLLIRSRLHG